MGLRQTVSEMVSEDPIALRTSVTKICDRHEVIKRCVEMVPLDSAMPASLRERRDQNTRDLYARFQGQEVLRDALVNLPQLECAR